MFNLKLLKKYEIPYTVVGYCEYSQKLQLLRPNETDCSIALSFLDVKFFCRIKNVQRT